MRKITTFIAGSLFLAAGAAWAAEPGPALAPAATAGSTNTVSVAAIPTADVAAQAEAAEETLRDMESGLAGDEATLEIEKELPPWTRELNARLEENVRLLASHPSLDRLRKVEYHWREASENLADWERDLTRRVAQFDKDLSDLSQMSATWQKTLAEAQGPEAPADLHPLIIGTLASIQKTTSHVEAKRQRALWLLNRVAQVKANTIRARNRVKRAREDVLDHLTVRDSSPIWNTAMRGGVGESLAHERRGSLSGQVRAFMAYADRKTARFVLQFVVFLLLLAVAFWIRGKVEVAPGDEPELQNIMPVMQGAVAVAALVCLLMSGWIYPQAPRLLWALWGAAALFPTVVILRRIVDRHLFPVLHALMVFYLVDQVRTVVASLPVLSRILFVLEMAGGILFVLWLMRPARWTNAPPDARDRLWRPVQALSWIALSFFTLAFGAAIIGYVNLASLTGGAILGSAYLAVILYAMVRIVDVLILFLIGFRPLASLGMVRRHRLQVWRWGHRLAQAAAFFLWVIPTLELLCLRAPLFDLTGRLLNAQLKFGSVSLSLSNVLAFAVTVWVAVLASKLIRFALEEDIYPRFKLGHGLAYAISTMVNYAILVTGFLLALGVLGVDMTKFTILAGAFGVGVGFGTQNIINNFVSGLILLFERPVKVGDQIQIDDAAGVVKKIGIRATIIRTANDSEVIVPNGSLISSRVTNWTATENLRTIEISLSVASAADPQRVMTLLKEVALAHPQISKEPAPRAYVSKMGADAAEYLLRVWTDQVDHLPHIRSDLSIAISSKLSQEKIILK